MFKSDFRFVAEYFVANRKKKEGLEPKYTISLEHLKHVEEFTELMNAITNSDRFSNLPGLMKERGGAPMFTLLFDEAEARGKAEGEAKGEAKSKAELIVKKVEKGKAIEQIADEMETTPAEIKKYYDAACKYITEYSGKELVSKIVDMVMKEQS